MAASPGGKSVAYMDQIVKEQAKEFISRHPGYIPGTTIDERADEFAAKMATSSLGDEKVLAASAQGYYNGAMEQREIDIRRAIGIVCDFCRKPILRTKDNCGGCRKRKLVRSLME